MVITCSVVMAQQNEDCAHISSLKWTETCINFARSLPQVIEIKVQQLQSKRVPLNPCLFRLYLIHAPYFIMSCEMPSWKWVAPSSKHEAFSSYMFSRIGTVGNDLWGQSLRTQNVISLLQVGSKFNGWKQSTALFWVVTQRVVVISYRHFGTTYRSHLLGFWLPKMGPIGCPKTSVRNYHYSLRNNP